MWKLFFGIILSGLALFSQPVSADSALPFPWVKDASKAYDTLEQRIAPPSGFERIPGGEGSFAHWLRQLPMKPAGSVVMLFNGKEKPNQSAHMHVFNIDVGKRDLQQCADAIMRLRAEYLYSMGRHRDIAFNFTNGKRVYFTRKYRNRNYKNFRKYMNLIFAYAGTYSLEKELKPVALEDMQIGDMFIKGGFPGHAILVADMVQHPSTGEKRFLLAQSFMPAQEIHVLRNPADPGSAWYSMDFGEILDTPEWDFLPKHLKRFPKS